MEEKRTDRRSEITGEFAPRYRKAGKAGKTRILDEYLALVGGNRKYAPSSNPAGKANNSPASLTADTSLPASPAEPGGNGPIPGATTTRSKRPW
jgi:hypothetical protein